MQNLAGHLLRIKTFTADNTVILHSQFLAYTSSYQSQFKELTHEPSVCNPYFVNIHIIHTTINATLQ